MNRAETIIILNEFDILPRRSLGQNFLVDESKAALIAELARGTGPVLEIGPGIGALTEKLLERHPVTAIEIDQRLWPVLEQRLGGQDDFRLIRGDVLETDLRELFDSEREITVCANIPYQITTELFIKILTEMPACSAIILMVQKEAAERFLSGPGTSGYGPAPILASWYGNSRIAANLGRHAFHPKPKVTSSVLVMERDPDKNIDLLTEHAAKVPAFLKNAFANRRKTLRNNLKRFAPRAESHWQTFAAREGLPADARPEALTPDQWYRLLTDLTSLRQVDKRVVKV